MRRSTRIRLTLLPILASAAAVAHAQAPGEMPAAPPGAASADPTPVADPPSNAPGMTPPLSDWCLEHPEDEDCPTSVWIDTTYDGGFIHRGGFGGYFGHGGHGGHGG
jgi:hypothetical protein